MLDWVFSDGLNKKTFFCFESQLVLVSGTFILFPPHPPDAGVPGLELGLALVEEVAEVGGDGQQDRLGRRLVVVLPVPLVQQGHVVAHADQGVPQQLQLRRVDLGGDGAVAVPGQAEIGTRNLSQMTSFNFLTKSKTKTQNISLPILASVGSPRLCDLGRPWVRPPALSSGRTQVAGYNLF